MNGRHVQESESDAPRLRTVWREGIAPVTIAAVVTLGVAFGVDTVNRREAKPADEQPAEHIAASAPNSSKPTTPRFVVAVRRSGSAVLVRDVRTGKDVGVAVAAPAGQRFQQVATAGSSYVVSAYAKGRVVFSRLSLEKDGRPKQLASLARARVDGDSAAWSDMAVSGDQVAYSTYKGKRASLTVVSAKTGARRIWTAKSAGQVAGLSWAAGGTLSFVWAPAGPSGPQHQVRTLNTTRPSGDLGASSRPVLKLPKGSVTAALSRDGRSILTTVSSRSQVSLQEFSTATGRRTKVVWTRRYAGTFTRLTPDPTGTTLLAARADGRLVIASPQALRELPSTDIADATW